MQRLGLTLLAFTLVIGVIGCASASQTQDEAAVRALGDNFAKAFVQKNAADHLHNCARGSGAFALARVGQRRWP